MAGISKTLGKKTGKRLGKSLLAKALVVLLGSALIVQSFTQVSVAQAGKAEEAEVNQVIEPKLRLISEEPVTAGVQLRQYEWLSERASGPYKTDAHVLVVDLHNPHVELDVMMGRNNQYMTKQTVLGMTRETGAVAGVNGDFFHLTSDLPPLGPQISNSELIVSPIFLQGWYTFGVTKDRKPVIDEYVFDGSITAADGNSFKLAGVNRAAQWNNGVHSHVGKIHLYTPEWGEAGRADDGNYWPTEVLVIDGIVVDISDLNSRLPNRSVPKNGFILVANGEGASFVRNHLNIGDPVEIEYNLQPLDPNNTIDGNRLKMLIGGHTLLVKDGQPSSFTTTTSISGVHARTGVGYSQDGRFVYLITVDNFGNSKGMSLQELQQLMVKIGVWKGMNLDGGGSSTLVSRPLGEMSPQVINRTQYGSLRSVINGIGLYSTAPAGELAGFVLSGSDVLFLNETQSYALKAYDNYYNPMQVEAMDISWSETAGIGEFVNHQFTARNFGKTVLQAASGSIREQLEVKVIGREQLSRLRIDSSILEITHVGQSFTLPVIATTKEGLSRTLPPQSVAWEIIGFEGVVEGDVLTVQQLPPEGFGQVVASYNDFSTVLDVTTGDREERLWVDFDELTYDYTHHVYPDEVKGNIWVVDGFMDRDPNDHALYILYDFSGGTGNKASYAVFNEPDGVPIAGEPQKLMLDVLGDRSGNWLRTEVWDANGVLQRIDIHRNIDWSGWKRVSVDLSDYQLAYPIKMKHIYVASPGGQEQADRRAVGQIAIDNISFEYSKGAQHMEEKLIKLAVGRTSLTVNDEPMELDQAPILDNGTTLVPVRFIIDAMGGDVAWDDQTQKVTIQRNGDRLELWIGNPDINLNGQITTALLAPRIVNSRTMVPIRVIAEQLGWEVSWDQETKSITLQ